MFLVGELVSLCPQPPLLFPSASPPLLSLLEQFFLSLSSSTALLSLSSPSTPFSFAFSFRPLTSLLMPQSPFRILPPSLSCIFFFSLALHLAHSPCLPRKHPPPSVLGKAHRHVECEGKAHRQVE
ncbi:hypothetical protein K523DRAFT_135084 [Schizophyllum commune Tattone D]|nr:hypothetical protein K523DRAFT_135084 [Schizophyllum commune Tattone D]